MLTLDTIDYICSKVLKEHELGRLTGSTRFLQDLGFDSMNAVAFVIILERELDVDLSEHTAALTSILTVDGLLAYYAKNCAVVAA
jgi:acyl carrier protein